MTGHMHVVKKESPEMKAQRQASQKRIKESRKEKSLLKDNKEKQKYLQLCNLFRELGVGYEEGRDNYEAVRAMWEGKRAIDLHTLSEQAQKFLKESIPFHIQKDNWGVERIYFNVVDLTAKEADTPSAPPSRVLQVLVKLSKQPYSSVEAVYAALVTLTKQQLTKHRKFRLPGLTKLSVRYRPAMPARTGINPWTKKEASLPASPEKNRLKSSPDRELREWVEKNIPVVAPAPKKKKRSAEKHKKRKKQKKYTRYFDEQKDFHIA